METQLQYDLWEDTPPIPHPIPSVQATRDFQGGLTPKDSNPYPVGSMQFRQWILEMHRLARTQRPGLAE